MCRRTSSAERFFGLGDGDRYHATGSAEVRNIVLPEECGHLGLPLTRVLPKNRPDARDLDPAGISPSTDHPSGDQAFVRGKRGARNIVFAADLWYSIKKHWVPGIAAMDRWKEKQAEKSFRPMRGKLNDVSKNVLRWNHVHPYNAVHAVRIPRPLDQTSPDRGHQQRTGSLGLTGLESTSGEEPTSTGEVLPGMN